MADKPIKKAEPTYRMSMLPFGTYANPDGTESLGLAMPGMIQEPINALMRLAENSRFPDGRLGIPNPDNAQNREDVLTGLLSMYGGNALNPLKQSEAVGAIANARLKNGYVVRPNADGTSYFAHRDRGLDVNAPDVHAGMLGRPIGAAENVYLDPTGTAHVNNVAVSPNHRRQGVATSIYDAIADDHGAVAPSLQLEPDGMAFWQSRNPEAVAKYQPYDGQFHAPEKLPIIKARERSYRNIPGIDQSKIDANISALDGLIANTLYSDGLPSVPGTVVAGASEQNTSNPIDIERLAAIAFARQQRGGK